MSFAGHFRKAVRVVRLVAGFGSMAFSDHKVELAILQLLRRE